MKEELHTGKTQMCTHTHPRARTQCGEEAIEALVQANWLNQ